MEKTNIALAWKNGEMTILAVGGVDEVLAAYREAEKDESNDFVGMLRKPVWYKRNTPSRNKVRHERSLQDAEVAEVIDIRAESIEEARKAREEAELVYATELEAARLQAERDEAQLKLNQELAAAEEKERAAQAAKDDEQLQAAEESIVEPAPTAEQEARAKGGKKK